MKKWNLATLLVVICVIGILAMTVVAGSVYDRDTATLGTSTGTTTWTNSTPYAALLLKRIWIENSLVAGNTVTVTRVTSDGTYTQNVGTVAFASGSAGNTNGFTASYLKNGDKLVFAGGITTGATAVIEYEVQKH